MQTRMQVSIVGAAAAANLAAAQSLNVDLNTRWGGPSSAFRAASGQAGEWNSFDIFRAFDPPVSLAGLDGMDSGVTAAFPLTFGGGSGHVVAPVLPPQESSLLDDFVLTTDIPERLQFDGLQAGTYDIYMYGASLPNSTSFLVRGDGDTVSTRVTGGWNGAFEEGVNFATLTMDITGGRLSIDWVGGVPGGGLGAFSGAQIVLVPAPGGVALFGVLGFCAMRRHRAGLNHTPTA